MEIWDLYNYRKEKIGKTVKRGDKLEDNEYHIVVNAWIRNKKGEFLITRRSANKSHPLMWECTGGSAVSGETSIEAACREVHEELGIEISPNSATFIGTKLRYYPGCPDILDVWLFEDETPIEQVTVQEEEVCDVMWASPQKILQLKDDGLFEPNAFFEEALGVKKIEPIYYIGLNANNAICNDNFFAGSITLYPTKEKGNHYYSQELLPDTKSETFMKQYREFIHQTAKKLQEENADAKFLCFNAKIKKLCYDMEDIAIIKEGEKEIHTLLNDKFETRALVKDIVPLLDYKKTDAQHLDYQLMKEQVHSDAIVLQAPIGSGGSGTFLITSQDDIDQYVPKESSQYCLSKYVPHIPLNITMIIGEQDIVALPISVQLILLTDHKFKYVGGDYIASQKLDSKILKEVEEYSDKIARLVQEEGYRGILGIDYIVDEQNHVFFMEINARFQASSFLLSQYLKEYCHTSIAELHYNAIMNRKIKDPYLRIVDSSFLNCNKEQGFSQFQNATIVDKGYFAENTSSVYRKVFDHSVLALGDFEKL